jgi:hypothetical protein
MSQNHLNMRWAGRFPEAIGQAMPQLMRADDGHLPGDRFHLGDTRVVNPVAGLTQLRGYRRRVHVNMQCLALAL